MTVRKPLVIITGATGQLVSGDTLTDGAGVAYLLASDRLYSATPTPYLVEGTTPVLIGGLRLPIGTATVYAEMGSLSGSNSAVLKVHKQSDNTLMATLTQTGGLAVVSVGSINLDATTWYELRGYCSSAGDTAIFHGVSFNVA